jgi:6-phosphogluconolactonase
MTPPIDRRVVADADAAAAAALELVLEQADAAIAARGRFVLGLSGGSTPERLYRLLAKADADWGHWHLVYGDERCLPLHHEDRTSTLVEGCWLNPVGFPRENHHVPDVERGADTAAAHYAATIEPLLPLDLALLGIGEDGHTASLFPGHRHPVQTVVPVKNSPKPPPERISLSYETLSAARALCFLVIGTGKQQVLQRILRGDELPAASVFGKTRTTLITDLPLS